MILCSESHVDHGLTPHQVDHILKRFGNEVGFFIQTFDLPPELGEVPCGLYGPAVGDPPVLEHEVTYAQRSGRTWASRVIERPMRPTRTVTVIAGPHGGDPCVLYTAFGGPTSPQEPGDPSCKDPVASAVFWRDHALALQPRGPSSGMV